jgi:hypothetical protein
LIEPKNQAIEHSNIIKGDATLIVFCSIFSARGKSVGFFHRRTSNWQRLLATSNFKLAPTHNILIFYKDKPSQHT